MLSSDRIERMGAPSFRDWLLGLAAAAVGFAACAWLAPRIAMPALTAYVLGFVLVVAAGVGIALCTPRPGRSATLLIAAAFCVLVGVKLLGAPSVGSSLAVMLALLALGSLIGASVGSRIEHPGHLLFVALVSACADTFSVAAPSGPSAAIAASPEALSLLAVSWPMLGSEHIEAFLGVGDLVFTSLYIAASRAHGLSLLRTSVALALAFLVTMLTVMLTELAIPALPFLSVAILLAQPAARVPPAKDRMRGIAATCALCALFMALLVRRWL